MLDALVEGAGIAHGEDVRRVLAPGPADGLSLDEIHRKLHVHRNFNASPGDFTIPLQGVPVAQEEQSPLHPYRKIDRDPLFEAPVVHIAPVRPRSGGGDGLAPAGGHPKAAQHGLEGQLEPLQTPHRRGQPGGLLLQIHVPVQPALRPLGLGQPGHVLGVDHVGGQHHPRPAAAAVGPELLQPNHQGVAHLGALDVKRPGHGVPPGSNLPQIPILAGCIHAGGLHRIARRNAQDRRVGAQGVVVVGGFEGVGWHSAPSIRPTPHFLEVCG